MFLNSLKTDIMLYAEVQCNPGSEILTHILQVIKSLEISLSPFLCLWV